MPLLLQQVTHESEFEEIVRCEWESYQRPLNTFFRLFRYDQSEAGFIELRDRQIQEWKDDKTSRWLKIVDTELNNKVVGAAKWNIFTQNPYTDSLEDAANAYWWPEGEKRDFASTLLKCLLRPRWEMMAKPHILLAMLFTHADHRRRGAARQLIEYGIREADRLGLEIFIEATVDGRPFYEACGFEYLGTNYWDTNKVNPSPQWMELERYLNTPIPTFLMWRPAHNIF